MGKTHRPCFILAIVLSLGIMAGKFLPLPMWAWLAMGIISLGAFFYGRWKWMIYAVLFFWGAAAITYRYLLPPDSIAFLSEVEREHFEAAEGSIDSEIGTQTWAQGEKQVFDLNVKQIFLGGNWQKSSGKVQVNLYGKAPLHYGQIVRVHGKIHPIFNGKGKGGFSYRRYLEEQGTYWILSISKKGSCEVLKDSDGNVLMNWSIKVRRRMTGIFYRYLDPREAGFVAAIVLGDKSGMPKDLKEIFVNTGTAHILAISGMNMTIISAIFFFILRSSGLPRLGQFLGTIIFLFIYAFLSGWSASVVRACLMSSVILSGFAFEYESEPLNSLGVAALILLGMDPKNLFDIGFQLSFAAVAGILILYKQCAKFFTILPVFLRASMSVSLAAWAGTVLIILYHFHMLTPISIFANIPIVPLADLIMALGLGLAAAGAVCPPLGCAFAGCTKAALSAMVICAGFFNQVPWGHFIYG